MLEGCLICAGHTSPIMQMGISMRKFCQLMRCLHAAPTGRHHLYFRPRDEMQAPYLIRHNAVKESRRYDK